MSNQTPTPAGWYDDGTGTSTQRYWDGTQWTDHKQPAAAAPATLVAPTNGSHAAPDAPADPAAPKQRNVLGIVALAVAAVGFIFACVPGALIVGWVLLPIGFILGIVALFVKEKGKGLAIAAVIVSVVGTVVGVVVFFAVVATSFDNALGSTNSEVKQGSSSDKAADDSTKSDAGNGSAKVGTRENPAALGSDIVGRDYTVKVNSVNLNATDAVLAANQFNEAPKDGDAYALVNVTITYTGSDSGFAASAPVSYVSAEGKVYNSFDSFATPPDPAIGLDELYKGASTTGNVVIEIPAAGDGLIRVSPGVIADKVFVKTK